MTRKMTLTQKHIEKLAGIITFLRQLTKIRPLLTVFVSAGMLGIVIFLIAYGVNIINPTNTSWLLDNGDLTQHYLGWEFYRQSAWSIPLGAIRDLVYPSGTSVVYMDSIPVAAIFFKLLQPILPTNFQYFGLWGMISFFLQGGIAALIIRKFVSRNWYAIIASTLFVMSPVLIMRMFAHTALASQWIILLAIALLVYRQHLGGFLKQSLLWIGLLMLSVSIHPYFVIMTGAFFAIFLILEAPSIIKATSSVGVGAMMITAVFWLIGGMMASDVGTSNLGMFGADMNAIINPLNYSYFMKPLPTIEGGYEGLAYMGLGVYIILIIAVSHRLLNLKKGNIQQLKSKVTRRRMVSGLVIVAVWLLAVGPVVYLNGHLLGVIPLPERAELLLSIFRSTGRFMWVIVYIVMIIAVVLFGTMVRYRQLGVFIIIFAAVFIQAVDVGKSQGVQSRLNTVQRDPTSSTMIIPKDIAVNKRHLVYTENKIAAELFFRMGYDVSQYDMTINNGYISRKSNQAISSSIDSAHNELLSGNLRTDTIYLTYQPSVVDRYKSDPRYKVKEVEDSTWLVVRQ